MLNLVLIIGNLGRDPEIRTTKGGDKLAKLSVATTERWKDRSGDKKERTEWHNVSIWGDGFVDFICSTLKKGDKVAVTGKIETREYQTKEGETRQYMQIRAQRVIPLSPREKSDEADEDLPF